MSSSTYTSGYNCSSPVMPEVQSLHGLYNQGSTCYLNSVLQVLFGTEDFREAVERHCHENTAGGNCLDCDLQSLFKELKWRTAETHSITKCLGIDRVNVQRDAAEYFEKILSLTSSHVSRVFRGLLTDRTTCSSCGTQTDSDGPFWHLPLALVDSDSEPYSVVNGTEDYFRESSLTGENQIYCDSCKNKSDGITRCVVKHHPKVLMLLLKRFTFDYKYMQYIKINSTVIVPYTLHIPENQTYELYAVVDHFGSLRGGHYTATIHVDGEWYTFSDTSVTKTQQVNKISCSAYLLFYKKTNADNGTHNIREVSTTGNFPTPKTGICVTDDRKDSPPEAETMTNDKNRCNDRFSPELCRDVDYQRSDPQQREEWYDCFNSPEAEKQKDKSKVRKDEEDVRGKSEAVNQTEKRETSLAAAQIQEPDRAQDRAQDTDCRRRDDGKQICIQQKEERRRAMGVKRDKKGKTEGSGEMTPDIRIMLQEAQRHSSGHSEQKESSTEAHEKEKSSGNTRLTKYDFCFPKPATDSNITDNTMIKHQTCRQRPQSRPERCLEQKEEKKDVPEASEQRRGHGKRSQSKERLERQHQYEGHVNKQNNGGSDDSREEKSEQTVSATHKKHGDVDEEGKTEGRRTKFPLRKSTGRVTENPGDSRAENSIQKESQPDGDSKDKRRGSKWKKFLSPRKLRKTFKSKKTSTVTPSSAAMLVGEKGKKVSNVSSSKTIRKNKINKGWKIPSADKNKAASSGFPLKVQNDRKGEINQNTKTTGCLAWQSQKNDDQEYESNSVKDDSNV